jgi:hypothetical protein
MRRFTHARLTPGILVVFLAGILPLAPGPSSVMAGLPDPAEIERLIRQLGSETFPQREAATADLDRIGEPALEALRKAAAGDADIEVRFRAKKIARSIQLRLDQVDVPSVPPPRGAVVLLDGKGLGGWVHGDGKRPAGWRLLEGGIIEPRGGDIMTRQTFAGPFRLHVEFRVPHQPIAWGQGRGNSGVYLQGRYEVQILDSYELPCDARSCAAVYGIAAPRANACKPPLVWQSFDIEFHPPLFHDGKKLEDVRLTVWHNGVKVHDDLRVGGPTEGVRPGDPSTPGPILLQDHHNAVQFRNVWLRPLRAEAAKEGR